MSDELPLLVADSLTPIYVYLVGCFVFVRCRQHYFISVLRMHRTKKMRERTKCTGMNKTNITTRKAAQSRKDITVENRTISSASHGCS